MEFLKLLFGARKQNSSDRAAVSFGEINLESEYSKKSINKAKSECRSDEWLQLEHRLHALPIVKASMAQKLLVELYEGEDQHTASSLDAAMCFAAQRTCYNEGNFAELVRRSEVKSHPVPYVMALHAWRGAFDAFGTKATYFVRISEASWLCAGQTRYGT